MFTDQLAWDVLGWLGKARYEVRFSGNAVELYDSSAAFRTEAAIEDTRNDSLLIVVMNLEIQ